MPAFTFQSAAAGKAGARKERDFSPAFFRFSLVVEAVETCVVLIKMPARLLQALGLFVLNGMIIEGFHAACPAVR